MSHPKLEFIKEKCTLAHVNVRTEMHGEDRVRAYDLKFTKDFANAVLLKFHPDLLSTFYAASKQQDIEANYRPDLKFGLMGAVSWDLEVPRTMLTIHDIDGNDLVLVDGKTNKFKFEMLDGGTVKVSFRCQFSELDEDDAAKMLRALNETVPISLVCKAAEEEETDKFKQAELLGKEPISEGIKDAVKEMAAGLQALEVEPPPAVEPAPVVEAAPAPAARPRRGKAKEVVAPE